MTRFGFASRMPVLPRADTGLVSRQECHVLRRSDTFWFCTRNDIVLWLVFGRVARVREGRGSERSFAALMTDEEAGQLWIGFRLCLGTSGVREAEERESREILRCAQDDRGGAGFSANSFQ